MTKHEETTTIRELNDSELDRITGGTKQQHPSVVDVAHDAAMSANNPRYGKVGGGTLNI